MADIFYLSAFQKRKGLHSKAFSNYRKLKCKTILCRVQVQNLINLISLYKDFVEIGELIRRMESG